MQCLAAKLLSRSLQAPPELHLLLSTLGHAAYNLTYYAHRCDSLSVPSQFFLVLIKFRVHVPNFQLSRMFAVSKNAVSRCFS